MRSHRLNNVIFSINDTCVTGLVTRANMWPLFKFQSLEIMNEFSGIEWWRVLIEDKTTNRMYDLIAQNVTNQGRIQSYMLLLDLQFA